MEEGYKRTLEEMNETIREECVLRQKEKENGYNIGNES